MEQGGLFEGRQKSFGTEPYKLVRSNDPETSVEAACGIDTTDLERKVYEVVASFGRNGCIANDVEARLLSHASHTITPRFRPLLNKGLIEETGEKRVGIYGRNQRVVRVREGEPPAVKKAPERKSIKVNDICAVINMISSGNIDGATSLLQDMIK